MERLDCFVGLVIEENTRQNLIAPSTVPDVWHRHVADSLQLLRFSAPPGPWIDIGSGAGFPGLVVAIASSHRVMLVEPRRLRAKFLRRAATVAACSNVEIVQQSIQNLSGIGAGVISARAVAPVTRLFDMALSVATTDTMWIMPKGRSADNELETARKTWHGNFCVEPSFTDPEAGIVVAHNVRRKGSR